MSYVSFDEPRKGLFLLIQVEFSMEEFSIIFSIQVIRYVITLKDYAVQLNPVSPYSSNSEMISYKFEPQS